MVRYGSGNAGNHDVLPAERPARRNAADLDPQYPVPCGLLCIRSHPSGAGRYRTFRGSWAVAGTGLRRAGKPDLAHWPAPHELSGASRWTACMNADARHHAVSYGTRRRLRPSPSGLSPAVLSFPLGRYCEGHLPYAWARLNCHLMSRFCNLRGFPCLPVLRPDCLSIVQSSHIQPLYASASRKQQAEWAWGLSVSATSAPFTLLLEICRGSLPIFI